MKYKFFLLLISILTILGCRKEITSIGSDLLPFAEINYYKVPANVTFIKVDSINTENTLTGLLGELNDTITGNIKCSNYTSWGFIGTSIDFGINSTYMEANLNLYFATRYGDVTEPLEIKVYEITQDWDPNKIYASKDSLQVNPAPIAVDTVKFDSDTQFTSQQNIITIKLDNTFGQKLFNADPTVYVDANAFKNFFKGLYIEARLLNTNSKQGVVYSIIYNSIRTSLDIVYKTENGDTNKISFIIRNNEDKFFTKVSRRLSGNEVLSKYLTDSMFVFIQPMALIWGHVEFPDRNDTLFINNAINKAVLELYSVPGYNTLEMNLNPPPAIYLREYEIDSTGQIIVNRNYPLATSYYSETQNAYIVDITTVLQQYLADTTKSNKYILEPIARNYSLNRVILGGTKHKTLFPVIKIFYSKIN